VALGRTNSQAILTITCEVDVVYVDDLEVLFEPACQHYLDP
jgi:hypothetical protein